MAYVIHVEQLERAVLADRTGLIFVSAMSSEPVDLPDLRERRATFDAKLVDPPEQLSEAHRLLREWGVG